jgi:hypothetical protein
VNHFTISVIFLYIIERAYKTNHICVCLTFDFVNNIFLAHISSVQCPLDVPHFDFLYSTLLKGSFLCYCYSVPILIDIEICVR